ncbi:MAG TPA: hypothetical protein VEA79_04405 [Phenylobacterium sp.]|nr:hypothetical protein [Phenylobacterium sp.]
MPGQDIEKSYDLSSSVGGRRWFPQVKFAEAIAAVRRVLPPMAPLARLLRLLNRTPRAQKTKPMKNKDLGNPSRAATAFDPAESAGPAVRLCRAEG